MKREWVKADIVNIDINATAQNPTDEIAFDLFNEGEGYFVQGVGNASGIVKEIPYYPEG